MTEPTGNLEVLDLRHFSAAQLRPLLRHEAVRWERRLNWDYATSAELLLEYLDGRVLPGFAALRGKQIVGYTFGVLESAKAVIGDVYAPEEAERLDNLICDLLLRHLIEMLQATPGVSRIESQLLMFPAGALAEPLLSSGFHTFPRLFMQWDFASAKQGQANAAVPAGLNLQVWQPEFYEAAAEAIHRAYQFHVDSGVNDQYRTIAGSQRFLHNVIRFPGCGKFLPANSWVVREEASGKIQALLLSSQIRKDVGHVTQLCVAPELRGHGIGRLLLNCCARHFADSDIRSMSLTVTEANAPAVKLYEDLGFKTLHRFDAMIWNSR